ncbi:MAG: hypothetical protein H7A51_11405 [Akkermansiaceae bacterium]|nr:hypothetical protein [Akkermansiaceae bacterium]
MEYLSPVVVGGLYANSMGRTIPKVVVASPDQTQLFAAMSYAQTKNEKAFRTVDALVKAALAGDVKGGPKDAIEKWPLLKSGNMYTGRFVEFKEDKNLLILKANKGKPMKIPFQKLSAGSKAYARLMAAGGPEAAKPQAPADGYPIESWESAKGGKSIQARFVSLQDGKITLKKSDGSQVTFSLTLLSEKSQQRANELVGE